MITLNKSRQEELINLLDTIDRISIFHSDQELNKIKALALTVRNRVFQLPIKKGSIVRYQNGYCRVSAMFKNTVNLCGIFSGKILHKKVPLSDVREAEKEWYTQWQQSETYKSM